MLFAGIATIGALYIVAFAIGESGVLEIVSRYVLREPSSTTIALARLMIPCAALSAFINNTPIVAMMIPVVLAWSSTVGVPPSKLLIPLSYATLLGG
jgi:Na+/H+ antiporter NhaD/arsenite permease-like protein